MDIMRKALAQAGEGRRHILGEMAKCSPPPQEKLSKYAPKVVRFKVSLKGLSQGLEQLPCYLGRLNPGTDTRASQILVDCSSALRSTPQRRARSLDRGVASSIKWVKVWVKV